MFNIIITNYSLAVCLSMYHRAIACIIAAATYISLVRCFCLCILYIYHHLRMNIFARQLMLVWQQKLFFFIYLLAYFEVSKVVCFYYYIILTSLRFVFEKKNQQYNQKFHKSVGKICKDNKYVFSCANKCVNAVKLDILKYFHWLSKIK